MYQPKARHILSPLVPDASGVAEAQAWPIFLAVGRYWRLSDDPVPYRGRFAAFIANRIRINPLYAQFYALAGATLTRLTDEVGEATAWAKLFANKDHHVPTVLNEPAVPPITELDFVQVYVVNEFIAFRLSLGGFADFGAQNYTGFFGGGNVPGEPAPYRTATL